MSATTALRTGSAPRSPTSSPASTPSRPSRPTLFARATVGTGRWIDVNLCAIDLRPARPQGRRTYSGGRRAARAQRAGGFLPDQRRLDDGHAGERAAIQAAVRGDRTRRSRQRSAVCRFCAACGCRGCADPATAGGVSDAADGCLAVAAACRRSHRRADPQSRRMAAQRPCRGDQGRGLPGYAGRRTGVLAADAGHCELVGG